MDGRRVSARSWELKGRPILESNSPGRPRPGGGKLDTPKTLSEGPGVNQADSRFGNCEMSTFVGLRLVTLSPRLVEDRWRLEDVASGYWTLSIKQSSGLVSHYGSTPSSSARPLDLI